MKFYGVVLNSQGYQMTPDDLRQLVSKLQADLADVLLKYGERHPDIPAQVLMAGLGELLINFSISQAGSQVTLCLLDRLKEAVIYQGPRQH